MANVNKIFHHESCSFSSPSHVADITCAKCTVTPAPRPSGIVPQRPEEGRCVLISECDFLFFSVLLQPISDKEGKRCMFCVKTSNKTFEMSASDQKQKVEWIQGLSLCMTFTFGGACYRITNVGT